MKPTALLLLLLAFPVSADSSASRLHGFLDEAARAGFAIPHRFEPVSVPSPRARPRRVAAPVYGPVHGAGQVSGSAFVFCRRRDDKQRYPERIEVHIPLSGSIEILGPDGARGYVTAQGNARLTGWCHGDNVELWGDAPLAGSGALMINGVPAGNAYVSGQVSVRYYGWGIVSVNEWASVSGYFTPY